MSSIASNFFFIFLYIVTDGFLFGFKDMRQKLSVKSVITKECIKEVQKLMEKGDSMGTIQKLRELRYGLEVLEKRIKHKQK